MQTKKCPVASNGKHGSLCHGQLTKDKIEMQRRGPNLWTNRKPNEYDLNSYLVTIWLKRTTSI